MSKDYWTIVRWEEEIGESVNEKVWADSLEDLMRQLDETKWNVLTIIPSPLPNTKWLIRRAYFRAYFRKAFKPMAIFLFVGAAWFGICAIVGINWDNPAKVTLPTAINAFAASACGATGEWFWKRRFT